MAKNDLILLKFSDQKDVCSPTTLPLNPPMFGPMCLKDTDAPAATTFEISFLMIEVTAEVTRSSALCHLSDLEYEVSHSLKSLPRAGISEHIKRVFIPAKSKVFFFTTNHAKSPKDGRTKTTRSDFFEL